MDDTKNILIAGAGNIGKALATILESLPNTHVTLIDQKADPGSKVIACDVSNANSLFELIQEKSIHAIVSSLPYFYNLSVAEVAKANQCHYFDLTEDVRTTDDIFSLAENASTAFVPQCGVAPGFINIVASHLIRQCDTVDTIKLYCGALPQEITNSLGYTLNWSTEGLINEYGNACRIIENGQLKTAPGLSGLEELTISNTAFEAFFTSGGVGTLIDTYKDKVNNMFYKTMRYPGHCEKMQFLMQDLKLNEDRDTLKRILENAIPINQKDLVITHVVVSGAKNKKSLTLSDTRHFYPSTHFGKSFTAIQTITSLGAAVVIDTVLSDPKQYQGPIKQEDFDLDTILKHPLADYFKTGQHNENTE